MVLTILKNMTGNGKDYSQYIVEKKVFETNNQDMIS
jgi:hypothetical protein